MPRQLVLGCRSAAGRRRTARRAAPAAPRARGRSRRARGRACSRRRRARARAPRRASRRARVLTSTPITPETTTSAPSTTRSAAIVSAWKPGSPGVSTRLILRPCHSTCAERRGERHPAPLLVLVPVGDRRAGLDGAEPVRRAGLEEHRLDERGLPRPAMADDGDVADLAGLLLACARVPPRLDGVSRAISDRDRPAGLAASTAERVGTPAVRRTGAPSGAGSPSCAAARRATR